MGCLFKIAIIVFILLGFCGCSEQKQATKKVSWLLAHDLMDDECARLYPVMDSLVKGDTIVNLDTLYLDNDVFIRDTILREGETVYIEKKCPPTQTITKKIFVVDTLYRESTAEVNRLNSIIQQKDRQAKEKDDIVINQQKKIDKNDWWKIAALATWALILVGGIIRFFVIKKPV
jgi:hypothetical protein